MVRVGFGVLKGHRWRDVYGPLIGCEAGQWGWQVWVFPFYVCWNRP